MTSTDWPLDSASSIPLPADVSSSDLFGGDLFGDELIEMYGTATEVGGTNEDDLLGALPEDTANIEHAETADKSEAAANTKNEISALDGFGTFRPCTSFNDFAELLSPTSPSMTAEQSGIPVIPISPTVPTPTTENGNKRSHASIGPATAAVAASDASKRGRAPARPAARPARNPSNAAVKNGRVATSSQVGPHGNNGPVLPAALLPTGKGVKVGLKPPAPFPTSIQNSSTPNPLGSAAAPNATDAHAARSVSVTNSPVTTPGQPALPDQVVSEVNNFCDPNAKTEAAIKATENNASVTPEQQVSAPAATQAISSLPAGVSEAMATAAAVAAASKVPAPTAADFTAVAQAAVSNLILSAGVNVAHQNVNAVPANQHTEAPDATRAPNNFILPKGAPDTSTAHINALTSTNWVTAVNNNGPASNTPAPPTASTLPSVDSESSLAPAAKRRRQNLTPDERAKQNRDRNREHARNTRLRKKAYVEELKRTLTELVAQRDSAEIERRRLAQRELEQREVRYRVMEEFLNIRGTNEANPARWAAILEDAFVLTLPCTPFRDMVVQKDNANVAVASAPVASIPRQVTIGNGMSQGQFETVKSTPNPMEVTPQETLPLEQVLKGPSEAMADAGHLAMLLEHTYNHEDNYAGQRKVALAYECNREKFFMDGCHAVLDWTAKTVLTAANEVQTGANFIPLTFKGSMRATFSPASNKLVSAELTFDTGVVVAQLKRLGAAAHADYVSTDTSPDDAAAEADAILDSLEMPFFPGMMTSGDAHRITESSVISTEKCESEIEDNHA